MSKPNFISAKASIHELRRIIGNSVDINKADILAGTNDALDRILTAEQLTHKVVLLPVENYKVALPDDFKYVAQAAFRETCDRTNQTRIEISQLTQKILGTDCNLEINLNCPTCNPDPCSCGTPIVTVDVDRAFESANPQLLHGYMNHFYGYGVAGSFKTSPYHPEFRLMRVTCSNFFNVPYHIGECLNINLDCNIEYMIEPPNMIINQKEGEVLLSYFGLKLDEDGYRMMPDDPTVIKAVTFSLVCNYLHAKYIQTTEQKDRIAYQMHVELTEKWIARARQRMSMLDYDEMHSFVTGFIHRVVPAYKYWEDLDRRRGDSFKYPGETYNLRGYN